MTDKTFNVAGIVIQSGVTKARFANDMIRRIKQFTKGGAARCDFVELPNAMTKVDAIKYLQTHEQFQSAEDQATLADALADRTVKTRAVKLKKEVKVKVKKEAPSLEKIKARGKKAEVKTQAETLDNVSLPAVETETATETPAELPV